MSINVANISGNLTRDPELRNAASSSVLNFTVAVNERVKKNGEWTDSPSFIDCVAFGSRADALSRILAKGMKVFVFGRLHQSSWEKDGQRRSKIELYANDVELASRAQRDDNAAQNDDEIPF